MKPKLTLAVQFASSAESLPTRQQFRKWVLAAVSQNAEIALRIVDAEEGRRLNKDYRDKDYATNVLTFPLNDVPLMGDIVLCAPVIAQEAAEQGKTLEAHYAHLTVHGVLHLQGHDHENDADAEAMEQLETQIVTKLGYPAPYLITEYAIAHGR
jgi:probable rRNA maturation factor